MYLKMVMYLRIKLLISAFIKTSNCLFISLIHLYQIFMFLANKTKPQSAKAVECADCISTENHQLPNRYPGYDTKPSDGESLVME